MEWYNEKILEIWQKYVKLNLDCLKSSPMFYGKFEKNAILFVGMNPSFSKKGFKKIVRSTKYEDRNLDEFLKFDLENVEKTTEEYVNRMIEFEILAQNKETITQDTIEYFKVFKELVRETKWHHIDLYLCRVTKQKTLCSMLKDHSNVEQENFFNEQLNLFFDLIKEITPKVIIVVNKGASDRIILEIESRKMKFAFDENIGTYLWDETPIFFSSMLSGQRALDTESRKRLGWHIRYVEQKLTEKL